MCVESCSIEKNHFRCTLKKWIIVRKTFKFIFQKFLVWKKIRIIGTGSNQYWVNIKFWFFSGKLLIFPYLSTQYQKFCSFEKNCRPQFFSCFSFFISNSLSRFFEVESGCNSIVSYSYAKFYHSLILPIFFNQCLYYFQFSLILHTNIKIFWNKFNNVSTMLTLNQENTSTKTENKIFEKYMNNFFTKFQISISMFFKFFFKNLRNT